MGREPWETRWLGFFYRLYGLELKDPEILSPYHHLLREIPQPYLPPPAQAQAHPAQAQAQAQEWPPLLPPLREPPLLEEGLGAGLVDWATPPVKSVMLRTMRPAVPSIPRTIVEAKSAPGRVGMWTGPDGTSGPPGAALGAEPPVDPAGPHGR